jgi:DNA repair exonuclease SbcCD nuclease subunit
MKIAVVGDVHLGCSDYTDKRVSDFSHKFVEAIDLAVEHHAGVVLLLGDIFDSSAYRRSVDSFAKFLHEIAPALLKLKSKDVPIVAILGNHEYGRGREGGEMRILSDLGFVHLLNDQTTEVKGLRFSGISWKNDIHEFRTALSRLQSDSDDTFLLIHQFVKGSRTIPEKIAQVDPKDLQTWKRVFVGHHHVHESFGNICIPGSLEISNILEIARHANKGFVVYDSETDEEEFISLKALRPIKYSEIRVEGQPSTSAQKLLKDWIIKNAEPHALLIVKLLGKLSSGRSSEIDLRSCRVEGIQRGCLDVYMLNAIDDPVRTASDIRSAVKVDEFLKKWFKRDATKAISYFDKFHEMGEDFALEIKDRIVESLS